MADDSAFRQAILDRPNAPEPRLAFADWLDENCDPLGEFIRVQQRLSRNDNPREVALELERRERELLGEFEASWLGELPEFVEWWSFRHGFVEEIALSAESFLAHADRLFALAPIRVIHFSAVQDPDRLAACPQLRRLHFIDLSEVPLGNSGVRAFAESGNIRGVHGLNLSGVGLANSGAQALARAPSLRDLRQLYLSDNRISDTGGCALARSRQLANLEEICLRANPLGGASATALRQRFGAKVHIS